jgi:hypothetical protein
LLVRIKRVSSAGGAEARRSAVGFHALCQGLASGELGGFLAANDRDPLRVWRDALTAYARGIDRR